jgi:prepilin-type N-terminal cleavage/methylation domain-containing protein
MRSPLLKSFSQGSNSPLGYSLVEMAVVLAIIGTVTGGALVLGTAQEETDKARTTKERLDRIEAAIERHAYKGRHLPCPAVPNAAEYGISEDCIQTSPSDTSIVEANDGTTEEIWIGTIPTRSLNLPDSNMYDGWGNRFGYAVVKGLAVPGGIEDYSTSATSGVIEITDAAGNQIPDADPRNTVSYAVFSHGKDGK